MNRKRVNLIFILFFVACTILLIINTKFYINSFNRNNNAVISSIINNVREKYPDVDEDELIDVLTKENIDDTFLKTYGIDIYNDGASLSGQSIINKLYITDGVLIVILLVTLGGVLNIYIYTNNKNIKKLTFYVEEINKKNYKLDLISNKEGELSILQNEIYKTMVMLKESADNSLNDKISIKNSLSDISHQLKTPITSINIALDNIIDDPKMDVALRNEFIMDIKRDIININFLVYNILKLSQFDTNVVKFRRSDINLNDTINEAIKNVSVLADLKNVTIDIKCAKDIIIKGDAKWEIEALTNIIKNSIEYSNDGEKIIISVHSTDVFTEVSIKDFGSGIEKSKIKRIFERFYKTNDSDSSFGIGLSLAKEIIEADNGRIKVKSEVGKGTEFIIRYIK